MKRTTVKALIRREHANHCNQKHIIAQRYISDELAQKLQEERIRHECALHNLFNQLDTAED